MKLEYNKGILFIRFKGYLDKNVAKKINQVLIPKVLEQKIKYIVLNLYDVLNVDSFALDALLNLKCAVKCNKGKICLCEISKELDKKIKKINIIKTQNELQAFNVIGAI